MCLSIDRASFSYPDGPQVLSEATWTFVQGGYTLVRGPSGSGKSTLLRLLCRLEEIDGGVIRYQDRDIADMAPATLRRSVAYVQQVPTLLPGTVRDNLLLSFSFGANSAITPPSDAELATWLESFLLGSVTLGTEAGTLSVGQAQRVCLIRSLLLGPEVILLDEPTASLDPESAAVVLDKARELNSDGMTVIMISHSETPPDGVTGIVTLRKGKLVVR